MTLKPAQLQWSDTGILRSLDYGDVYFQPEKGVEESSYVFLEKNNLPARFAALPEGAVFHVAELGFGTGLNFLLTARLWADHAPASARLYYTSFEKHPIRLEDLKRIHAFWPELLAAPWQEMYPPLVEGLHSMRRGNVFLRLALGDARELLPQVEAPVDAWYLDGFAPAKNPEMWEEALCKEIFARTRAGGSFATFSAAGAVKRGLAAAGFGVEKTKGFGVKRDMLVGAKPGDYSSVIAKTKQVTVLGAGLAGASVAYALANKGCKVEVIDRQPDCAMETSGNAFGVLYQKMTVEPSALGVFYAHGFAFTRALVESLALPSWRPCGVRFMPSDTAEEERQAKLLAQGYDQDFLCAKEGLFQPMAGFLSPRELCRALLSHPNIRTTYTQSITALPEGEVVIALGNGSNTLAETAWLPLQFLRGQVSMVEATEQSRRLDHVVCHEGYILPAVEGVHCMGATFQKEAVGAPEVRVEDHRTNLEQLHKHMPELGIAMHHVRGGRTGWRATTPDKLPLVGRVAMFDACVERFAELRFGRAVEAEVPYVERLYVTTGFGAHGLAGAPLAGEMIAAEIMGEPMPVPQALRDALAPERFILRDLKRRKI